MSLKSTRLLLLCFAVFLQACGGGSNNEIAAPEVPADTTAPVITLTGDNPQAIELNGTYEELGATSDGNETVEIDSSAVDTAVIGSYTVTYNASDAAGNAATEVSRTVNVADTVAPVITLLGSDSQRVELNAVYEDAGATADTGETIVIDDSAVDTSVVGTYTVTFNVTDEAGNAAAELTRSVNVMAFTNLDFEMADGVGWTVEGDGTDKDAVAAASSFPATGGNPDGHWSKDSNSVETYWTVLYTKVAAISDLGLTSGLIYTVSHDSVVFSTKEGSTPEVAGMKVEFYTDAEGANKISDTGDIRVDTVDSGADWLTYNFEYQIPAETTHIKYVVLWGRDSHVGVDNVVIDTEGNTPPQPTSITSSDADGMAEITASGSAGTTELGGWNNTIGEWYGGATGYIGFFQLPDLGQVNYPFMNSEFGVRVFESTAPDWAADVSMVRTADTTDILDTDYGSASTLIQSGFLTTAVVEAVGTGGGDRNLFTTAEAAITLTEGLNAAYDGGVGVGRYVVIRIAKSGALPTSGSYKILTRNAGGENEHPMINFSTNADDTSLPGDSIRAGEALIAAHSASTTGGTVSGPEPEPETPDVGPVTSAPAPSADAANVVSIFSDAYTDLEGTDFNPNWGQATVVTTETIDGGSVLKYAGLNYQGTGLSAAQDVSGYDTLHVDFWTADSTALNLFLINSGDVTGGDAVEVAYAFDVSVTDSWVSVDIPLSSFSPVDLTMVDQMKVDGNGTIYWDNIYFSKAAAASTAITIPEDKTGNGPDTTMGTDDDVTVKGSYVVGDLTFVRPPVNLEAPADTWCPTDDGCTTGNSTAKDAVRMGSNLGFRRMQFAEAEGWCAAQNGRLPTRAEITTHIVPIVGNGKAFETDLVWPQATSKYWTADKNEAGDKAFVFTTRNYNNDNVVNNVTQSFNLENSPLWVMCIGAS